MKEPRAVLHLTGPILLGPHERAEQAWVLDGRITYQEPRHALSAAPVHEISGWVLPGLVDAHCHVGLGATGAVDQRMQEQQASTDRDRGTLLLRDAGSPADTRWIDDRDDLPRIIRAGRHIARTTRYIRNYAWEIEPDELVAHVQQEALRGDGWVKLVGDWIDRSIGDLAPCWPADALQAAIAAAHELGARVTAHCFGEECLPDLLAAGIDCIEHGTGLRASVLEEAARRSVAVVPTLVNIATFPLIAAPAKEKYPAYHAHMLALHARRHQTVKEAHEAGVPVYVGTDAGGSLAHGLVAREVGELIQAGMPVQAALNAACWGARAWLGRPALAEGDPADLVVYPADPRLEPAVLAVPSAVVLRGRWWPGVGPRSEQSR